MDGWCTVPEVNSRSPVLVSRHWRKLLTKAQPSSWNMVKGSQRKKYLKH
jgi:hypothetical protein